jgi:hypothetical protein
MTSGFGAPATPVRKFATSFPDRRYKDFIRNPAVDPRGKRPPRFSPQVNTLGENYCEFGRGP